MLQIQLNKIMYDQCQNPMLSNHMGDFFKDIILFFFFFPLSFFFLFVSPKPVVPFDCMSNITVPLNSFLGEPGLGTAGCSCKCLCGRGPAVRPGEQPATGAPKAPFNFPRLIVLELRARTPCSASRATAEPQQLRVRIEEGDLAD